MKNRKLLYALALILLIIFSCDPGKENFVHPVQQSGKSNPDALAKPTAEQLQVSLLSPANGSNNGTAPTLAWNEVPGAKAYTIAAAYDSSCLDFGAMPDGCSVCLWITSHPSNKFSMENYEAGTYYWRAAVYDEETGGQSGWSEIRSFTMDAPTLNSPATRTQETNTEVTLIWNPYPDAVSYNLILYHNAPAAANGKVVVQNIDNTQYTLSKLKLTTTYSWQVTANTGLGVSGLSELRAFTTTGFIPFPHEGIVAWYPFNGSVYDYCEYNRINGVHIAGIARDAVLTPDRFGNANMAYWFNGSTAFLTFSGITQYYTTDGVVEGSEFKLPIGNQPRAFSLWFKTEPLTNESSVDVFGWGVPESNRQFGFALKSGLPQFTGMDEVLTGSGEWDDGRWHNVVINYDGNEVSLFMDGALNASRAASLNTAKSVVVIGQSLPGTPNPTNFFGAIDDIATYERVLTFDEIQLIASQR